MSTVAYTIPVAALGAPFSVSTLRKYVEEWERLHGQLPLDALGYTRLVEPLIGVFTETYLLREGKPSSVRSRLNALIQADLSRLPQVVTAYNRCRNRHELIGVEHLTARLTNDALQMMAVRLQELGEVQAEYKRMHDAAIDKLRQQYLLEMAAWAELQQEDVERLVKGFQVYAERLGEAAAILSDAAADSVTSA